MTLEERIDALEEAVLASNEALLTFNEALRNLIKISQKDRTRAVDKYVELCDWIKAIEHRLDRWTL